MSSELKNKITDWKGNEVKDGMTIYFVRTKPFNLGKMGWLIPGGCTGDGKPTEAWESDEDYNKRISEEIWELGRPYEVSIIDERLFITSHYKDDPDIESLTQPLHNPFGELPMIAIKGISDKKELSK